LFAIVVAGAASFGCGGGGGMTGTGGGSGGGTCTSNASCGGDIVGTWTIVQACNARASKATTCGAETYTVSNPVQTGTLTFRADGTATVVLRTTGTLVDLLPPICLTDTGQTCADVEASYRELVQSGAGYTSASCADNAGTCECTLGFDTTSNVSGTYATSGSTFTVLSPGTSDSQTYCVTGSTLIINVPSTTSDPPVIYVLTRQ
jgi:hypothetical protein